MGCGFELAVAGKLAVTRGEHRARTNLGGNETRCNLSSPVQNVRPAQFSTFVLNGNLPGGTAQIAEAYSGEGDKPRWAGVQHCKRRTSAPVCIDPDLRAAVVKKTREELDLEHLRGKFTGVAGTGTKRGATTSAGDGADREGTPAAKGGGRQWRRTAAAAQ